jgi:drug/metabolite transporter (DMT)-like permease
MAHSSPFAPAIEHSVRGILLRIGSASAFGVMAALLKLANDRGVLASEMVFYRALFGLPVVVAWLFAGPGLGAIRTRRPFAHLGRAALGISSVLCTFKALTLLSLADATTIGFTAPIFATVFSALILREHVGRHRWLAVAIGFVGMLIVVHPGASGTLPRDGLLIALLSAVGTAGVTITLRQISTTEHVAAIVFWFFVCSVICGGVLLLFVGHSHSPGVYAILGAAGLAGGVAQLLMTGSLRFATVAVVAPFDYIQLLWAIALGWLLFASVPLTTTLIGALLIAASGLYTVWREHRRRLLASVISAGALE